MDTALATENLDHSDAMLDRIESLLTHVSFANFGGAVRELQEIQTLLMQCLPSSSDTPDRDLWIVRLSEIQLRVGRIRALVEGAAAFHRGWVCALVSEEGYGSDGALNEVTHAQRSATPLRVRTMG